MFSLCLLAHYKNMDRPAEPPLSVNPCLLDPKPSQGEALAEPTGPPGWRELYKLLERKRRSKRGRWNKPTEVKNQCPVDSRTNRWTFTKTSKNGRRKHLFFNITFIWRTEIQTPLCIQTISFCMNSLVSHRISHSHLEAALHNHKLV